MLFYIAALAVPFFGICLQNLCPTINAAGCGEVVGGIIIMVKLCWVAGIVGRDE